MKMYRKRVLTLLFLLQTLIGYTQNVEEDDGIVSKNGYTRYLGIGAGAAYRTLYDEVMSSMRYERVGATAMLSNIKINETKHTELLFQGSYLKLGRKSDELVKANMRALYGSMDYRHLYKLDIPFLNDGVYDFRAGGMFTTQFCYKNAPHLEYSSRVTEYAIALGASMKLSREMFVNDRKSFLIWEFSIPFIEFMSRPGYLNQPTILNTENSAVSNFFANNTFGSWGKYMRLNSRVSLLYAVKNGNKIRITYQWDYYKMKGAGGYKVYTAEHSLMLAFLFNY